jgi:anti-sigma factor (TIGR02949 family)
MAGYKKVKCDRCTMPKVFYKFLDKDLAPKDIKRLKTYLAKNKSCCGHMEFEESLRQSLGKTVKSKKAPKGLKARLKKKLSR